MTFISYAQNYEDVMLWRALKHIENGFYIDVGAAWPDKHSVTKAFYDRGWCGINVEPNPIHHASLINQRSRDINLQFAVGASSGVLTMNLVGDTGLSTLDSVIAGQHQHGGWGIVQQTVSVETLAKICSEHIPSGQEVHFLKVDVEGFEEQALRGHDWINFRPWIVLVEATLPMTQQESHGTWETILLEADYYFAYADGLNRFYVSHEQSTLAADLKYPPNVFDRFLLSDQYQAEVRSQQSEATVQIQAAHLDAIYRSKSWRITAPLRWIAKQVRLIFKHGPPSRFVSLKKRGLRKLNHHLLDHPTFRNRLLDLSHQLGIYNYLKKLHFETVRNTPSPCIGVLLEEVDLSPRARKIHRKLKITASPDKSKNT